MDVHLNAELNKLLTLFNENVQELWIYTNN